MHQALKARLNFFRYTDGQREVLRRRMFEMVTQQPAWRQQVLGLQAYVPSKKAKVSHIVWCFWASFAGKWYKSTFQRLCLHCYISLPCDDVA